MSSTPSLTSAARLLIDAILSGEYPPGSRLPPERELAQILGASRATLREVLRQLGGMRMIEAKRSSGVHVRPLPEWSFEVLPEYLVSRIGREDLTFFFQHVLDFRRELVMAMFRLVAPYLGPGALDHARTVAAEAWAVREDPEKFMPLNVEAMRACVEASGNLPALWLFNQVMDVFTATARVTPTTRAVPRSYLDCMMRVFTALEQKNADGACAAMKEYYDREDRAILGQVAGDL